MRQTDISVQQAVTVLGLKSGDSCTPNDIKKRFRELSLKYHPDKGGDVKKFDLLVKARQACLERPETVKMLLKPLPPVSKDNAGDLFFKMMQWHEVIKDKRR